MARGASKCVEKMEKEVAPQKRHYCRPTALSVFSSFCSVASIAFCVFLSINGADIKNRVVDLESGKGEHTFTRATGSSVDDLNSLIQQRVDELLSQVRLPPALAPRHLVLISLIARELTLGHCKNRARLTENDFAFSHCSAPTRISSRFAPPDKHHLNATALQVKETTFPVWRGRVGVGGHWLWSLFESELGLVERMNGSFFSDRFF